MMVLGGLPLMGFCPVSVLLWASACVEGVVVVQLAKLLDSRMAKQVEKLKMALLDFMERLFLMTYRNLTPNF